MSLEATCPSPATRSARAPSASFAFMRCSFNSLRGANNSIPTPDVNADNSQRPRKCVVYSASEPFGPYTHQPTLILLDPSENRSAHRKRILTGQGRYPYHTVKQ